MVGTLLIGLGTLTIGGAAMSEFIQSKKRTTVIDHAEYVDRTPHYTQLFENLKLMDTSKGDWIKCIDVAYRKNYRLIRFQISDTLSYLDFVKAKDKLEEKMLTDYKGDNFKNKLQVYKGGKYMYFRVLNEKIELIPYEFKKTPKHLVPLGTNLDDEVVYWDLKKDVHMKLVGSSGSGKSRQQNIIINHIYHNIPNAKLWLMDFKCGIELGDYANTKNCVAYAETLKDAPHVLQSFKDEYESRMQIIKAAGCRSFDQYIAKVKKSTMQRGFLIADEFSDLMDLNDKKTGYDAIKELIDLARKVRASGLSILIASQRSTADSIPSSMKNNITATLGMKMENSLNSRLVIDEDGCELLQQSEVIGILESKKTYFRSFYIEDEVMDETVKKFAKPPEPASTEAPKKKKKQKGPIK